VGCLFAARLIAGERHHLLNDEYCVRAVDGTATRTKLRSSAEVLDLLRGVFGIDLPVGDGSIDLGKLDDFVQRGASPAFHAPAYTSS
jgi:hypothetical protein